MTWHADYPNTFTGNSTQNVTTDQLGVFVGFIPTYGLRQMWMTESIGSGIIQSIAVSQLCQLFLKKTVGTGCTWASTCAINSFVYTITVVMMGTSSALFNPAVMFGWAILGRTNFKHWILLFLAQTAGAIVGTLCSWSQNIQYLARVPIPRKDKDGNFIYIQVDTWKWRYMFFKPNTNWLAAPRPQWKNRRPPLILGGAMWAGPEYDSSDRGPEFDAQPIAEGKGEDHDGENGFPSLNDEELRLAESPEYQAELRRDQKAKLQSFAETPNFYSPYFIYCWWPHIMAGTTLVHWLSFMTGNCTQLTNTNMYLTQPVNGTPGSNYSFLNGVLLAWLMGLAYFLLSASAGTICTLQLNPANDIGARICHWLLPIPNKGYSGWSYAWVPIFFPFMGASVGAAIMYMSMFAKLSFPFLPYGSMRHWW